MENINKQSVLPQISEVAGEIKEIEHENSSDEFSSEHNKENASKQKSNNQNISKNTSKNKSSANVSNEEGGKELHLNNSNEEDSKKSDNENSAKDEESDLDENENQSKSISGQQYQEKKQSDFASIEDYYEELRKIYSPDKQFEDQEFGEDRNLFQEDGEEDASEKDIEFERIQFDDEKINFFAIENSSHNIDYEFKIKRGIMRDRFFLGAFIMLFRRKEEFFTNLILDPDHLKENIAAGFIGFTFFINGEWKNITIDTKIPKHQNDEISLSNTENPNAYWMCLFEKAYSKIFKTYTVLEMFGVNDFLVDLTGGWAKMTEFSNNKETGFDENKKKSLFEEIQKALEQKYLIGCMKYDDTKLDEDFDADKSEDGGEDEAIAINCMYNILDAQEDNSVRLIYLVNYWPKGKWTGSYSVEDETWEANKALAERLNYQVSQSDGTFWMSFDDWVTYFNRIYYCRIFPENWSQYVIAGKWTTITSGGAPPKHKPWYPEKFVKKDKDNTGSLGNTLTGLKSYMFDKSQQSMLGSSMNATMLKKKTGLPQMMATQKVSSKQFMGMSTMANPKMGFMQTVKPGMMQGLPTIKSMNSIKEENIKKNLNTIKNSNTKNNINDKKNNKNKKHVAKVIYNPIKRNTVQDTEDRFFLNPQYKIEITPGTRLNISLMQEDRKLQEDAYLSVAFLLLYCRGRYSRVWEIKEENIIKKAFSEVDGKNRRETMIQLDYLETLKKINETRKKKLPRGEAIQMNLIPYIDYNEKYKVEKPGKIIQFKIHAVEAVFWLRLYASTNIYVAELNRPYERTSNSSWQDKKTAGGARYITERGKTRENPKWPINPQYLITFDKNIAMKIILKKTNGHFSMEENKIGFLLTKPEQTQEKGITNKQKTMSDFNKTNPAFLKTDQIFRVMESTQRILGSKSNLLVDIYPKMYINNSEWVIESSYGNAYCSCLFMNFNKIDSPLILIPTLDMPDNPFEFELKIYSNRPARIISLNNDNCCLLIGEWKEGNCGGCHLSKDDQKKSKRNEIDDYSGLIKKKIDWYQNPKYHLCFETQQKFSAKDIKNDDDKKKEIDNYSNYNNNVIPQVEFEIVLTRFERIWKPIVSRGVVNSMLGIYIFKYDTTDWKKKCINLDTVEFMPQNEISIKVVEKDVDPRGFIIMPVTYGEGIKGPFLIMAKCKTKFSFTKLDDSFQ